MTSGWHGACKHPGSRRLGEPSAAWAKPASGGLAPCPRKANGELPMQNTLLVGLSRQVALERELGVVSNNIANLNTNGYKADGSMFEEYLAPGTRDGDSGGQVSFVRDRPTWIDMSQ